MVDFFTLLWKLFPGSDIRPTQVEDIVFDLSHDPIWAIQLAGVSKFHQQHDRINLYKQSATYGWSQVK